MRFGVCSHRNTITTITAGLAREVCETCARVRLRYVEPAVKIDPDTPQRPPAPAVTSNPPNPRTCRFCSQHALYLIPDGAVCDEHAWQAAARLSWDEDEPWVPIRIDSSRA